MKPKVYIIILNWNGWKDTVGCLESICCNAYENYEVIVCDNGSTDESVKELKKWRDKNKTFILLETGKNFGFAGGNNVGIRYAMRKNDMDYIWILNNDTVIQENALIELMEKMQSNHEIGICGSKLMYYDSSDKVQGFGGIYNKIFGVSKHIVDPQDLDKLDYVIGASMLVSKKFLQEIGLMSEEYFLYYEELDWAMRAKGRFKLACACDSVVYHKEGASINGDNCKKYKSKLSDYYYLKNKLLFTRKYYKHYLPTVYCSFIVSIFNRIRRRQFDRVMMIFKIMF